MSQSSDRDHNAGTEDEENEFSLTEGLIVLGQERKTVAAITAIGLIVTLAIALLVPRDYIASTLVMPPQQQSGLASGALAQLGALSSVAGGGLKSPEDMYIALLKSRSLQDALVQRLQLQQHYGTESLERTRAKLAKAIEILPNKKSGLITISASDTDASFAAQLANAHVVELRHLMDKIAVTDAQQRRMFFEHQVKKAQDRLSNAELQFRKAQSESGMVVSQALAESGVREGAQLRGQIAAREVQLQTLTQFATSQHPDVQRINAELGALRKQLSQIERGRGSDADLTPHGIKAVQAFRDMKVQEALLETLIKQLELARADEAKEGPLLQQIDMAVPPERPVKPKRSVIMMIGALLTFLATLTWIGLKRYLQIPNEHLEKIRQAWR